MKRQGRAGPRIVVAVVAMGLVTALAGCASQSPAEAAYAKRLSGVCGRLLTPALEQKVKRIVADSHSATERERRLLGVSLPFDARLAAVVPPSGDPAAQMLRRDIDRFIPAARRLQAALPSETLAQGKNAIRRVGGLGGAVVTDIAKVGAKRCEGGLG